MNNLVPGVSSDGIARCVALLYVHKYYQQAKIAIQFYNSQS